ncbi:Multicopper oxidase [Macleaya cordata]|uniref:Laccase n=1 Tax=Macleaya cordata TaxID=56857 RepID=A0A200PX91_MACCD|nr:Multicopper oxidase [Macleaya cordata]
MASRFGMAAGIPERRIRPIWEAVDSRQFKNALKLTTALLTKYPNSPYVMSLKALIMERMGKPEEALSLCLNAKEGLSSDNAVLSDDHTLSTIQTVCQRLGRLDIATSCYEYACGKVSNNLELMMGLFNCYVRERSFVKQQQTAIKMYKLGGEERFLLWAVCSIQLQVFCGTGIGGEKLLLLAEGLLKKHIASHSLHEPEALLVYISVMEQQAKYNNALQILSGELGSLLVIEVDRLRIQGRLLARACDYPAAAEIFKKVLESCPDDWECFLDYIGCLLEDDSRWCGGTVDKQIHPLKFVDCKLSHLSEEVFDLRISEALCFVQKLHSETDAEFIRCPYLANLEIERRKRLYGKGEDKLMEAFLNYFSRFGHLGCFTSDVEMFLQVLTNNEELELIGKLIRINASQSNVPVKALEGLITISKIQEWFGNMFKLPLDGLEETNVRRAELYCQNLSLSKDLDPQETMHGEELLCMACNVLVQLFWRTRQLGYLLEAIMVLEFGLSIRRFIWQYKILLVHLYSHFSAFPLAYEWYKALDIKNILLETVSHHIVPQMLLSPLWVDLSDLLKGYLSFMDEHFAESADLTFLAYRHRNYSKVIEFVQFKDQLQHSHQYLMARLESPILQLKQKANNIEEVECVLDSLNSGIQLLELSSEESCKSLTFNDDMQSRPWWTPTPDINYLLGPFDENAVCGLRENSSQQEQTKKREANARKVIERRSLLPRLIHLSIQCASLLKDNAEANDTLSDGKNLELKALLERYARSIGFPFSDAVDVIVGISSGQVSFEILGSDVIDWMNFAVFLNAWKLGSHEPSLPDGDGCKPGSWHIVDRVIEKYTQEQLRNMQPVISSPGIDLTVLVQIVSEPLAWHSLVIQSCVRTSPPSGKKKKKSEPADQLSAPLIQAISSSIQSSCGTIGGIIKLLEEQINHPEDDKLDTLLSPLQRAGCTQGPGQIIQILEATSSSAGLGSDRISEAMRSWSAVDVARKIIAAQKTTLSEFHPTPVKRLCKTHNIITVNGQFPGPTLEVRNGDTLVVKVVNKARYNVTIHWHGIRQMRTGWADGPEFVTQCPIRPGESYTYRFTIEGQEGTLWWHAHSSWLRATVYGALIIYPREGSAYPFAKPKRETPLLLAGEWWDANPIDVINEARRTGAAPNISDAYTINGQPGDLYNCSSKGTVIVTVDSGETNLLRVTNSALNQQLFFTVANHKLTVVSTDASYTKPVTTSVIMLGPGQTTDVLIKADQPPARYYIAARAYASAQNAPFDNTTTTAILEYKSAPCRTCPAKKSQSSPPPVSPNLPAFNDTATATAFTTSLRSPSKAAVPTDIDENVLFTVGLGLIPCPRGFKRSQCQGPNGTRFTASMNNVSFVLPSNWSLLQAHQQGIPGVFTTDFPARPPVTFDYTGNVSRALWNPVPGTKLYKLKYGSRVQVVLQGTSISTSENHPIHLHGYDFYILAEGFGNFNPKTDTSKFNLVDPPLRNTVGVPVGGWAVIRFVADNPGVWLMHCHLDVHITWGLAMAFLVDNGVGKLQSIEPPPADLPIC